MPIDSNVLQHFFLRHLQQFHAIPKARWGECAEGFALPFALTRMPVEFGVAFGVHSGSSKARSAKPLFSGSFLAENVCWRAKRAISPATGPFVWEATLAGIHPRSAENHNKNKPLDPDTSGG